MNILKEIPLCRLLKMYHIRDHESVYYYRLQRKNIFQIFIVCWQPRNDSYR